MGPRTTDDVLHWSDMKRILMIFVEKLHHILFILPVSTLKYWALKYLNVWSFERDSELDYEMNEWVVSQIHLVHISLVTELVFLA